MEANQQLINSISRAVSMLELFDGETTELGIVEMGKRLDLHKTTVFRIAKTLEQKGWLLQNPTNSKYKLGLAILTLGHNAYQSYDSRTIILPELTALRDAFNEDVILSVASGSNVICVERLESNNSLTITSRVGRVMPMYCGATGKVFLPFQPSEIIEAVLSQPKTAFTAHTKLSRAQLEQDMQEIRTKGYALSVEEQDEGVLGIGVPIFDQVGHVAYAISLCGAIDRVEAKGVAAIAAEMLKVSQKLSHQMHCLKDFRK